MLKSLLTITAVFEGVTGLGLATMPSLVIRVLLGTSLTDASAVIIARLAGAALITIAIACWFSRGNSQATALVKAITGYNVFSITLLIYAALTQKMGGPGLWPAVALHVGLLGGCIAALRKAGFEIIDNG